MKNKSDKYYISESFRKQFCFLFSFVFFVIFYFCLNSVDLFLISIFLLVSCFFLICGIFFYNSRTIWALAVLWLRIGNVIGLVVNPVVLFILYFGIITPFGMFLKICGRDHLKVKKKNKVLDTYWETPVSGKSGGWEDQF